MTSTSQELTRTLKQTQATRKYDCVKFISHVHETAVVEFNDGQTHVTIYDATGRIVDMWYYDTTDASVAVNRLENMYLGISRVWD